MHAMLAIHAMHQCTANALMHQCTQCTNAPMHHRHWLGIGAWSALVGDDNGVFACQCAQCTQCTQCTNALSVHQCTNAPQATAAAREACLRGTIAELEQSLVAEREVRSVPLTYHIMARTQPATLCLHCRLQPLCSPLCAQPATPRVAGVAPAVPQAAAQVEGCVVGLLARGISTNGGGGPVKLWHVWPLQQRCGIR